MADDLFEMTDEEYAEWLRKQGLELQDLSQPTEENLCRLVSLALRSIDSEERAQVLVDVANVSLALADKAMGAQDVPIRCLVLQRQ
jgi:hypothetical protein